MEIMFAKSAHNQDLQHLHQQAFGSAHLKSHNKVLMNILSRQVFREDQ